MSAEPMSAEPMSAESLLYQIARNPPYPFGHSRRHHGSTSGPGAGGLWPFRINFSRISVIGQPVRAARVLRFALVAAGQVGEIVAPCATPGHNLQNLNIH